MASQDNNQVTNLPEQPPAQDPYAGNPAAGNAQDSVDPKIALAQKSNEVTARLQGVFMAMQNPDLGLQDKVPELTERIQQIQAGSQQALDELNQRQEALQKQIDEYQPKDKGEKTNTGIMASFGAAIGAAAAATAAFFLSGKNSRGWRGAAVTAGALGGGLVGGSLSTKASYRKTEQGTNIAEQIVLAEKDIEQKVLGLMEQNLTTLSQVCNEYEPQINARIQQLSSQAMQSEPAQGMVPLPSSAPDNKMQQDAMAAMMAASQNPSPAVAGTPPAQLAEVQGEPAQQKTAGIGS